MVALDTLKLIHYSDIFVKRKAILKNNPDNVIEPGEIGIAQTTTIIYRQYKYRWIILGVYMYVAALTQLYWLNFSAIDTYIEDTLKISAMSTGMLTLVFPIVYVILSIPAGILTDRKGFKYSVGIGVILTGIFSILRLADPHSYAMLLVCQIGIAIGQPFVLNGITKLVVTWFTPKEEATAIGLGSLSFFVGMIIGLGLTPVLVQSLGFEPMLLIYGILGVLGILLFYLLVKHKPPVPARASVENITSIRMGLTEILKNKNFIILGFVALIGTGVFNAIATWLEKILNEFQNIPMVNAGIIAALLVFAGAVGCVVIPMVSDRIKRRKPFLILAALVGTLCVGILMIKSNFIINMGNAAVLGFFLLAALPIMLTMSVEICGEKYAGISAAYLQLLGNGAAIAFVPLIEVFHKTSGGYIVPLAFVSVLLFIAFVFATRIKETGKSNI